MPMRVLLVSHYFSTHLGGVEIIANRLADRLCRQHSFIVDWYASDCDAVPDALARGMTAHAVPCCNLLETRAGLPWPVWSIRSLPQLWRAVDGADCVHIHDYIYFGSLLVFALARLRQKRIVITQHVGFIPYEKWWLRWTLSVINRTVGRIALGLADRTVFESETVMDYFSRFCSYRSPPVLIHNGVDEDTFHVVDRQGQIEIRRKLGLDEMATIFLFVGRFVEKKGVTLIRYFAEAIPNAVWLIVGDGSVNPESWNQPNTLVLRGRAGSDLISLYQAADLLVLPSKGEGFPLVVQEAMACGTPVFASSEWFRAGHVPADLSFSEPAISPQSRDRWTSRLAELALNAPRLRAMRVGVAAWTATNWSWQACTDRYADILGSNLAGSRGGAPHA